MFFNKTKATWKRAFEIRKEYFELFKYHSMVKKAKNAIKQFKSDDHCRKYAYCLAKQNNFQGSSEFYWNTSKKILNIICMGLEAEISDNEQSIFRLRWCCRFKRDHG